MKNIAVLMITMISVMCCAMQEEKKTGGGIGSPSLNAQLYNERDLMILPHGYHLYQRQLAEQQGKSLDNNKPATEYRKNIHVKDGELRCP